MRLLLDTHTLLWWWGDDKRLSKRAANAISNEDNQVLVSAASAWEIAIKFRLGKLPGADVVIRDFDKLIAADGFEHLAISHRHALVAGGFDVAHRDPFDRVLAAQSAAEDATLVTNDAAMKLCRVKCYW